MNLRALLLRFVAILGAVMSLGWPAFAQDTPAEGNPQTRFFKANSYYQDGAYTEAAREYEQLLASGLESGHLYFNLGNTYFKLGNIGIAIANYERAKRSLPGDPDVEANLAYAQSLSGAESCDVPVWQRIVFPLRGRLTTRTLAWVMSAFYTLAVAALIAHRFVPIGPRALLYAAGVFGFVSVVAGVSLTDQVIVDEWPQHAVVVGVPEAAARFEPADDGTVHFTLPEGSKVTITDQRDGWSQVARCDGRRGWMATTVLEHL